MMAHKGLACVHEDRGPTASEMQWLAYTCQMTMSSAEACKVVSLSVRHLTDTDLDHTQGGHAVRLSAHHTAQTNQDT